MKTHRAACQVQRLREWRPLSGNQYGDVQHGGTWSCQHGDGRINRRPRNRGVWRFWGPREFGDYNTDTRGGGGEITMTHAMQMNRCITHYSIAKHPCQPTKSQNVQIHHSSIESALLSRSFLISFSSLSPTNIEVHCGFSSDPAVTSSIFVEEREREFGYVIVHTKFASKRVILWIELGDKSNGTYDVIAFTYDVMRASPIAVLLTTRHLHSMQRVDILSVKFIDPLLCVD